LGQDVSWPSPTGFYFPGFATNICKTTHSDGTSSIATNTCFLLATGSNSWWWVPPAYQPTNQVPTTFTAYWSGTACGACTNPSGEIGKFTVTLVCPEHIGSAPIRTECQGAYYGAVFENRYLCPACVPMAMGLCWYFEKVHPTMTQCQWFDHPHVMTEPAKFWIYPYAAVWEDDVKCGNGPPYGLRWKIYPWSYPCEQKRDQDVYMWGHEPIADPSTLSGYEPSPCPPWHNEQVINVYQDHYSDGSVGIIVSTSSGGAETNCLARLTPPQ
jgi:hypothetical protein